MTLLGRHPARSQELPSPAAAAICAARRGRPASSAYLGARDAARGERAAAELAGTGPGARFAHLDVTDPASAAAAVGRIDREQGLLDILVNNAGIVVRPVLPPSQTPVPDVRIVNLTSDLGSLAKASGALPSPSCSPATPPKPP